MYFEILVGFQNKDFLNSIPSFFSHTASFLFSNLLFFSLFLIQSSLFKVTLVDTPPEIYFFLLYFWCKCQALTPQCYWALFPSVTNDHLGHSKGLFWLHLLYDISVIMTPFLLTFSLFWSSWEGLFSSLPCSFPHLPHSFPSFFLFHLAPYCYQLSVIPVPFQTLLHLGIEAAKLKFS